MMEENDWYELCGNQGGGYSLFGRMERLKKLRLIAPDDGEEEKAKHEGSQSAGFVDVSQEDENTNRGNPSPPVYKQSGDGTSVGTTPDDISVGTLVDLE